MPARWDPNPRPPEYRSGAITTTLPAGRFSPPLSEVFMLRYFCFLYLGVEASATLTTRGEGDLLFKGTQKSFVKVAIKCIQVVEHITGDF